MALSTELENLLKSMEIEQGNGGFGDEKPGTDMLKGEDHDEPDEDDEGGPSDGDEDNEDEDEEGDEDMDKSLSRRFREDYSMAKSIDAAPILDELIAGIDDMADGLRKSIEDQSIQQSVVNEALIKGLSKSLQLLNEQNKQISDLMEQFNAIAGRPAPRKAAQPGTPYLEKSVQNNAPEFPREVVQQKLIKGIASGVVQPEMAQVFDRTGSLPAHVTELIKAL